MTTPCQKHYDDATRSNKTKAHVAQQAERDGSALKKIGKATISGLIASH